MARHGFFRNIQTAFWTDPKVSEQMGIDERYFFLYLLTNPHTNLSGFYEITRKQMADETGFTREQIGELLQKLEDLKILFYDDQTNEILIINWSRYNWTTSGKFLKSVETELNKNKSPVLLNYLEGYLIDTPYELERKGIDRVSIRYRYGIDTVGISEIEKEIEIEKETETEEETEEETETEMKREREGERGREREKTKIEEITTPELKRIASELNLGDLTVINFYDILRADNTLDNGVVIETKDDFINHLKKIRKDY